MEGWPQRPLSRQAPPGRHTSPRALKAVESPEACCSSCFGRRFSRLAEFRHVQRREAKRAEARTRHGAVWGCGSAGKPWAPSRKPCFSRISATNCFQSDHYAITDNVGHRHKTKHHHGRHYPHQHQQHPTSSNMLNNEDNTTFSFGLMVELRDFLNETTSFRSPEPGETTDSSNFSLQDLMLLGSIVGQEREDRDKKRDGKSSFVPR